VLLALSCPPIIYGQAVYGGIMDRIARRGSSARFAVLKGGAQGGGGEGQVQDAANGATGAPNGNGVAKTEGSREAASTGGGPAALAQRGGSTRKSPRSKTSTI
jgi:hypothetical protein